MPTIDVDREKLVAMVEEVRSISTGLEKKIAARLEAEELGDEEREHFRTRATDLVDLDLVETVMTMQKLVEREAIGRGKKLAQVQTTMLGVLLDRFAPVTFAEALTHWDEALDADVVP